VPVILIGDIDRGGVIAQLVGTHAVLPPEDLNLIKGFAINKFRGDPTLFADGMRIIADRTGWQPLGIVPWFDLAWRLPAEDVMDLAGRPGGPLKIAVPRLNRIANFDDLDPLSAEPDVTVEIVEAGRPIPADAALVLIPGSKSTIADLAHFRAQGWDIDLLAHVRRGGRVLGICGGYQMLGRRIIDADGIEGPPGEVAGLGLLDVVTEMKPAKTLSRTEARHIASGEAVSGYEIHIGVTTGPDTARPWLTVGSRGEGAASADGRVKGCYLHGLFSADGFRAAYLAELGHTGPVSHYGTAVEEALDALARHVETHLDVDAILSMAAPVGVAGAL
jgi:adenosylcobyric acid synthase